jgi:hypothetical protein
MFYVVASDIYTLDVYLHFLKPVYIIASPICTALMKSPSSVEVIFVIC